MLRNTFIQFPSAQPENYENKYHISAPFFLMASSLLLSGLAVGSVGVL